MGYKGLQPKLADDLDIIEECTLTQKVAESVKDYQWQWVSKNFSLHIFAKTSDCASVSVADNDTLLRRAHTSQAFNKVHGNPITSSGEVEGNDNPPVFDERWNTIDQAPEKRQKGEFDSHHCHPSEYTDLDD